MLSNYFEFFCFCLPKDVRMLGGKESLKLFFVCLFLLFFFFFCTYCLQPEHLLSTSDNVTVQCHTPGVIIRTVAAEDISSSVTQAELTVDSDIQPADLTDPPDTLETNSFPDDIHQSKLSDEEQAAYSEGDASKFSSRNRSELMDGVMVKTEEEISDANLKPEEDSHSDLPSTYVTEVRDCVIPDPFPSLCIQKDFIASLTFMLSYSCECQ